MSLLDSLQEERTIIDEELENVIPRDSGIENLYDAHWEFMGGGGKRWRPIMCLLVHRALGGSAEKILPYAAAIELVHNFSLIHDDIEDGDRKRRGKPTLWVKYGIPKAINIGDNLLNKAYESVIRLEDKGVPSPDILWAVKMLSRSTAILSEGQAMEMNFLERWDVSEREYIEMVWRKTGVLISAACAGGAYLADASESLVQDMKDYGMLIGPAFQIVDDVLNISGDFDKYKKEIGGDIGEGKKTLMVIHLLEHASPEDRRIAKKILGKPRKETTASDYERVISIMNKQGSVEYARKLAENKLREAKGKMSSLPSCQERKLLLRMTDFLVRRDF